MIAITAVGSLHERGWTFVSTPFVGRIRTAFPKVGQTVQILVGSSGIPSARLAYAAAPVGSSYTPPPRTQGTIRFHLISL